MTDQTISQLNRQLRSSEGLLDALGTIDAIDSFDPEFADEIVDDLIFVLEGETSAYNLLRLYGVFERLAQECPQATARAVETVAEMWNASVQTVEDDDISENRMVDRQTNILEKILDGTSPDEVTFELGYGDVRAIVQQGNPRHRAIAYRLLGRSGTGEAARILLQDFSHELESVKSARETGLENACALVVASVDGDGPLSTVETVDSFSELWAAGQLNPRGSQLDTVRRAALAAIETVDEDQHDELLAAIKRMARHDEATAEVLVSKALAELTTDPESQPAMWEVLRACAEGAPTVVLEHADEIASELDRDRLTDVESALKVVKTASRGVSTVPAVLATPILELIDSDDLTTARRAVETVGTMGFYPVPDQLVELIDQEHPSLSRVAAEARKRLRRNQTELPLASDLRSGRSEPSLFENDSGDIHVKVRTEEGTWVDLTLGPLREGIVRTSTHRLKQDENVPIVYPYFEPSDVVVLTLALVLQTPEADRQIALYSPGSQSQWGTKGQIRDKLREFGFADVSGAVISATPVPEIVPDAYVSDDRVKDNSDGDGPGRIILTKTLSELAAVSDIDVTLLNLAAKTRLDFEDEVRQFESDSPDADVVSAYSYYTRNERDGRPRYGPPTGLKSTPTVPGPDLVDPVLTQTDTDTNRNCDTESDSRLSPELTARSTSIEVFGDPDWQTGDDDVHTLGEEEKIRIDHVETRDLATLFDKVFDESAKLFETDASGSGGLIFSRQMFFERLPIPPDDFDEWVRDRYEEGDRFVPPLIRGRTGDIEQKANAVENLEAVKPLNTAKRLLDRIHEQLRDHNPLFEKLCDYVTEARRSDERLAIFSPSPKNAQLLRDTLIKHDIVTTDNLDTGPISVVSPDEAKRMAPHDTLLVFGSLHPEHAGFYVHPRVGETTVVTYDRTWAAMIERHASEHVSLLNDVVGEAGYEPYAEPNVTGDLPSEPEEAAAAEITTDAMRSASATEYGEEAGRYERELRRYLVTTEEGEQLHLTNRESVPRQSSTDTDVHWINPDSLSPGDTVVTLPDETEEELWREHLREFYEDQDGADVALNHVQTWQEALVEIWNQASNEITVEDNLTDMEIHRRLHGWITEEIDDFDRTLMTVRKWFESAREADRPMETVQDPSFVIGPQSASDIAAIGRAFGYDALAHDAERIQSAMRGLRTINRQEGHKYRDSLRERINSDEDARLSEAATYRKVADIREVDDFSEAEFGTDDPPDDIDSERLQRVRDIVELGPTDNRELAGAWGYDSGSKVYQYLDSHLDEYYERNEESMIVPTPKAIRLIEDRG